MKFFKRLFCCHIWEKGWHPEWEYKDSLFADHKETRHCIKCGKKKVFNRWDIPFDCRYRDL